MGDDYDTDILTWSERRAELLRGVAASAATKPPELLGCPMIDTPSMFAGSKAIRRFLKGMKDSDRRYPQVRRAIQEAKDKLRKAAALETELGIAKAGTSS